MRHARESGQATVEWIGLLLLAALLLGAIVSALSLANVGLALPGAILERFVCAVRLTEDCRNEPELRAAFGADTAALLRENAPALFYEDGMSALPVDFRVCRRDACAAGPGEGSLWRTDARRRVAAFTNVIDCREGAAARTEAAGADCSGERAGNLYLQYFFYYPGSATGEGSSPLKGVVRKASSVVGHSTFHEDDWESLQIKVEPDGTRLARASAHKGYGEGWVRDPDALYISGGSHAGEARFDPSADRSTKDHRLRLIPMGEVNGGPYTFAISPPWLKRVYLDPEYEGTD